MKLWLRNYEDKELRNMEKRNYVKPGIDYHNIATQSFIAGSGFTTNSTTTAVNIIEACFKVKQGDNDTITDSDIEAWLQKGNTFIAKADNQGDSKTSSTTCSGYFTNGDCYEIALSGTTWTFKPAGCTTAASGRDPIDLEKLAGWDDRNK